MRYTKKPVTIEAVPFIGISSAGAALFNVQPADPRPLWLVEAMRKDAHTPGAVWIDELSLVLMIGTLEGNHTANPGDWIIQGIKGELYPCKPDIFDQTYSEALPEGFPDFTPADYLAEQRKDFPSALAHAINVFSKENGSDTPDWILAQHLVSTLDTFNETMQARAKYYGESVGPSEPAPPADCPLEAIHEQGIEALQDQHPGFQVGKGFTRQPIGEDDQD